MAPDPDWRGAYKELAELLKSLGDRPGLARWQSAWPSLEVRRCGSTKTSLYIPRQSDLDLVLYFPGREVSRPEQLELLRAVAEELRRHFAGMQRRGSTDVQLIEAKAPIVQFSVEAGLVVDMSVQSVLALANSTLVSRYCGQSPELRLLARKVKEFATAWNVKSGKDGTLSSYGYTLLCIHFLQNAPLTGANVPVLPVFPGWQSDYGKLSDRENADPNNKVDSWSWNKPIPEPYYSMADVMHGVMTTPEPPDSVYGRELLRTKLFNSLPISRPGCCRPLKVACSLKRRACRLMSYPYARATRRRRGRTWPRDWIAAHTSQSKSPSAGKTLHGR
jgi:hypothetical protein